MGAKSWKYTIQLAGEHLQWVTTQLCSICQLYTLFIVTPILLTSQLYQADDLENLSYGDLSQLFPVFLHSSSYKQ